MSAFPIAPFGANATMSRHHRDSKAAACAALTGSPDESGRRRREKKSLAQADSAAVRRGMIQLAGRVLWFQKGAILPDSARARR
jgi:transposase